MTTIAKLKLHNFKRFKDLTIILDSKMNIFIGDNESGKSSILQAIDLVARGSRHRIEEIGLERLFNVDAISTFMDGDERSLNDIPKMFVELYFDNGVMDESLEGNNNSGKRICPGIKLVCEYDSQFSSQINQILKNRDATFPFEFFTVSFSTFAGESYNAYTKKLNSIFIDNSQVGSPHAMREYIRDIYRSQLDEVQRASTKHSYHQSKVDFQNNVLSEYNKNIYPFSFAVRETSEDNIETDVTLVDSNVPIENKGSGTQCFIKTELSLKHATNSIETVLIEEPENHLSYTKVIELIGTIKNGTERQIFIATHSDLIATRLDLRKCVLLNSSHADALRLNLLDEDTAKFFMKAPDNNMLKFVLSPKTILVEGDAEFILMEAFFKLTEKKDLESSGIGVIAVGGKCFKRYLKISKVLRNKVAVITDNDKDYDKNITQSYAEYDNIHIFADADNERYTFEVCVYQDNKEICDGEFSTPQRKLSIQDYMLSNKTEAAFSLLKNHAETMTVPQYIQAAIQWINN